MIQRQGVHPMFAAVVMTEIFLVPLVIYNFDVGISREKEICNKSDKEIEEAEKELASTMLATDNAEQNTSDSILQMAAAYKNYQTKEETCAKSRSPLCSWLLDMESNKGQIIRNASTLFASRKLELKARMEETAARNKMEGHLIKRPDHCPPYRPGSYKKFSGR